ncbi:division/cell wall cluster transcriptional repressor MraZ [Flavobacterium branchiophilum NBRC 15030 = ATCC 35035]|uniref:Transcriptional regulator MraZ n=2 Tax=Flavobacterium branchiophilum TaxID=55197 RepID=G2Z643_FLABF|nr:division/cell wall cluster transcriptional repressor MraZ [Flavobacterium branchiophilum]OXA78106.1 division/cell wall cluster transcriptional repressor MraZ [Flavobacterium branchiophilum NBRC 15030 = ATCC 35035]PDS24275.1 division/cell wall cluster transcriptional repressor MraZ [Flavobacterium branchiophilum]TQM41209.1 MraZ protein [Flavobacterium branchiophilum]CCB68813.1 Protein MraZ [Flavobacterium branchiophilum FL-15]GEM54434.1 transcriptional regulator MraZ [Flavobacterium branchio
MESIIGTYECKIDNKGRIILPNALKKQLASTLADGFVLKRSVFQTCLELYPMAEFNKMMQKINKLNKFSADNNNFIRRFSAGVKMIDIDGLGRLLIPKDLLVFGQFSKEIVLSSAVNIIEIWDKDLYEKAIDDSVSDFAKLAQEVMSNLNE